MSNERKAFLFMSVIHTLIEIALDYPSDISELEDALGILGLDPSKVIGADIVQAVQYVSREFANLEFDPTMLDKVSVIDE